MLTAQPPLTLNLTCSQNIVNNGRIVVKELLEILFNPLIVKDIIINLVKSSSGIQKKIKLMLRFVFVFMVPNFANLTTLFKSFIICKRSAI